MDDAALLTALEPTVEQLVERHYSKTKEWFPHKLVPWSRAKDFGIDPAKLGVLGFSAGGHLAADLAVSHAERTYSPIEAADDLSAKPAYVGLLYPVVTLIDPGGTSESVIAPSAVKRRSPIRPRISPSRGAVTGR